MTDFVRTVTITLAEYDQLRRDAAPVQSRVRALRECLTDAFIEYVKLHDRAYGSSGAADAKRRLGGYIQYVQRAPLDVSPVPFGDWEIWTKPGEPS